MGGGVGLGDGLAVSCTNVASDDTGVPVASPTSELLVGPPGRANETSIAPITSPTIASARAAMIGRR